jgi:hypothetical protein
MGDAKEIYSMMMVCQYYDSTRMILTLIQLVYYDDNKFGVDIHYRVMLCEHHSTVKILNLPN